jgi:hypothetical protein
MFHVKVSLRSRWAWYNICFQSYLGRVWSIPFIKSASIAFCLKLSEGSMEPLCHDKWNMGMLKETVKMHT